MHSNKWLNTVNMLFPYRRIFLLLAVFFASLIIYSFVCLAPNEQNSLALPSLLALLWSLMLYTMLIFFQNKPQESAEKLSIIERIKRKFHRGLYVVFSLFFLVLTLAVILVTFRMFSVF